MAAANDTCVSEVGCVVPVVPGQRAATSRIGRFVEPIELRLRQRRPRTSRCTRRRPHYGFSGRYVSPAAAAGERSRSLAWILMGKQMPRGLPKDADGDALRRI